MHILYEFCGANNVYNLWNFVPFYAVLLQFVFQFMVTPWPATWEDIWNHTREIPPSPKKSLPSSSLSSSDNQILCHPPEKRGWESSANADDCWPHYKGENVITRELKTKNTIDANLISKCHVKSWPNKLTGRGRCLKRCSHKKDKTKYRRKNRIICETHLCTR